MSTTNNKGDIGEAAFLLASAERGYWVGKMPQDCPYDFVMDRGKGLERIQVKYRSIYKGKIQIESSSKSLSSTREYKGSVDQFAVYVPELKTVYLIPAENITKGSAGIFRVEPTKNNQSKGITFITDFSDW